MLDYVSLIDDDEERDEEEARAEAFAMQETAEDIELLSAVLSK